MVTLETGSALDKKGESVGCREVPPLRGRKRGRESEGEGEGELCIDGEDNSDVNNDSIVYSDRLSSRGNLIL